MKGLLAVLTVVLAGEAAFYLMQDASQYGALRLEGRASVALLRDDAPLQATAGPTARSETASETLRCVLFGPFAHKDLPGVQERLTRSGLLQKAVVADRFLPERFIAYLGPYDNTTAVRAFVKQFRQQGIRTVKPILEGELSYGVEIASFSSREAAEKYLVSGRAPDMKGIKVTNRLGEPSGQVDLVFNAVTSEEEDRIRNLTKLYPAAELKSCY